ncbi:hypothetical protein E2C01_077811 [Portunus trituberculatus]|uniref:Uncharacterized protein n=1 Tax=Portunus trituberculatus TaxID=210409 RepID=A0A5B7IQX1_PORTR|nr:hypothetical protein [Portunus trituberculatus]
MAEDETEDELAEKEIFSNPVKLPHLRAAACWRKTSAGGCQSSACVEESVESMSSSPLHR